MKILEFALGFLVGYIGISMINGRGWANKTMTNKELEKFLNIHILNFTNETGTHGFIPRDFVPFEPGKIKVP